MSFDKDPLFDLRDTKGGIWCNKLLKIQQDFQKFNSDKKEIVFFYPASSTTLLQAFVAFDATYIIGTGFTEPDLLSSYALGIKDAMPSLTDREITKLINKRHFLAFFDALIKFVDIQIHSALRNKNDFMFQFTWRGKNRTLKYYVNQDFNKKIPPELRTKKIDILYNDSHWDPVFYRQFIQSYTKPGSLHITAIKSQLVNQNEKAKYIQIPECLDYLLLTTQLCEKIVKPTSSRYYWEVLK